MTAILLLIVVSTLVFVLTLIAGKCLFSKSPAKRKNIYVASLLLSAITPVVGGGALALSSYEFPGVKTALLKVKNSFEVQSKKRQQLVVSPQLDLQPKHQSGVGAPAGGLPPAPTMPPVLAKEAIGVPQEFVEVQPVENEEKSEAGSPVTLLTLFIGIWVLGLVFSLVRLAGGFSKSVKHAKQCETIGTRHKIYSIIETAANHVGLPRIPVVYLSPENVSPSVINPFQEAVVLSTKALESLSDLEIRSILVHEFSHIKRRDVRLNLAMQLMMAIHWFNPLVYRIFRQLRLSQEELSDNDAAQVITRFDYARLLVKSNQIFPLAVSNCALAMATTQSSVKKRVDWMLDENRDRRTTIGKFRQVVIIFFTITVSLAVGTVAAALQSTDASKINELAAFEPNMLLESHLLESTDGIYYTGYGLEKGQSGIIRVNSDGKKSQQLFSSFPGSIDRLTLLPHNLFAVAGRVDDKRELWIVDESGKGEAIGPDHGRNWIRDIECSPSGTHVACFVDGHTVGEYQLFLYDLVEKSCREIFPMQSNGDLSTLSDDALSFRTFCWSPDGKKLAMESVVRIEHHRYADMLGITRTSAIDILDLEDNSLKRVVAPTKDLEYPSWSPDGKKIAYRVASALFMVDLEKQDSEPKQIADHLNRMNFAARWSLDSKRLAIDRPAIKDDPARSKNEVFIANITDGSTTSIPIRGQIWDYAWGPDSSKLAISAGGKLFIAPLDGAIQDTNCVTGHWSTVRWHSSNSPGYGAPVKKTAEEEHDERVTRLEITTLQKTLIERNKDLDKIRYERAELELHTNETHVQSQHLQEAYETLRKSNATELTEAAEKKLIETLEEFNRLKEIDKGLKEKEEGLREEIKDLEQWLAKLKSRKSTDTSSE